MKAAGLVIAVLVLLILVLTIVSINSPRKSTARYVEIFSQLARPTSEQIRRFAEHVAYYAKNWYKLIPAYPEVPFVFYLDPDAGRHWVRKLKTPRRIPSFLTFEDIHKLLSYTGSLRRTATVRGKQVHAMISILYYLGVATMLNLGATRESAMLKPED